MDINPATRGHASSSRARTPATCWRSTSEDLAACARGPATPGRAKERLGADGVNLINSCGAAAWQTVFHFHLHVVPRYADDPLKLPWVPAPGDIDEIAAPAEELRAMPATVRLEREGRSRSLTLASPPLNLFDEAMFDGLHAGDRRVEADPPRGLLFRAEGRVVSGGVDVGKVFDGLTVAGGGGAVEGAARDDPPRRGAAAPECSRPTRCA